jgi:oligoendopeptidase F
MQTDSNSVGPAWDLSDEYSGVDAPEISADLKKVSQLLDEAQLLNGALASSDSQAAKESATASVKAAQTLTGLSEHAGTLLANVGTYAHCLLSVDSKNEAAQKLSGQLQNYHKRMGDVFEPLSQFIDDADEAVITDYLADPDVAPAEFLVRHGRERAHENLTLAEESLVNGLSQDGIHAWGNLYDQLAGTLQCEVAVGNETQTMGVAQASGLLMNANDGQRKNAWSAINTAWQQHEESCAASLNAISGWRLEMCKQRSRDQPVHFLDAPVHMNRISRGTLDVLMDVAKSSSGLAQRGALLQARAYNKEGYGPWDLRAPAPDIGSAGQPIPFDTAIEIIAQAYGQIEPEMETFVRMMVEKKWVEGTVGGHKVPGAYCTRFPKSKTPRVYMTYMGGQSDIITLAHELGHAFHAWVMRDLPQSQQSYGMSLAETASTFGETLVRDALLARAESQQERLDIMWEEISAFTAFLLNIPARYEFEHRLYQARAERPLRPDELKQMMSESWQEWYGDALAEPDPLFWASKLHFYISGLSFYNFPYLFGYLFSLGVYAKRDEFGSEFYSRYANLLRDTGRLSAEDLAEKHLGVKIDEPEFWQTTVQSLAPRIDAFETLLDEIVAK